LIDTILERAVKKYDFFKTKYGDELLIDMIPLEKLEKYIQEECPHYLTYYDITLLTGGKGRFCIDQHQYEIQRGTLLFSSPGQVRYWNTETLPKGYVILFEEEFLSRFLNDSQFINDLKYFAIGCFPQMNLSDEDSDHLSKLMENIGEEIETFSSHDQYILQALLYQTLVWINRKYSSFYQTGYSENGNRYIHQYTKLVNQKFRLQHSVAYYADYLHITSGHLNDLCKLYLGLNAKQYIQNRIMLEAKRLLLYTDSPVEEIAICLGFEEDTYFIRKFRQTTGVTPLFFRKNKYP
jgi:AraC-like DNA-binding protein